MFPAETWNEIGAWLGAYSDFANFAVALGVKWSPPTQAQRMVCKYGRDDFMHHIRVGDETDTEAPTRNQRNYIKLSNNQLRFYEYLIRRHPDVIAKEVEHHVTNLETHFGPDFDCDPFLESSFHQHIQYTFDRLEPLLRVGVRINIPTESLHVVVRHAPVVIEILLESGQLETLPARHDLIPETNVLVFARILRWGVPVDVDFLLGYCVRRSNRLNITPRLRMEYLLLIPHLLGHGANPKAVGSVPYSREAMAMLLDAGADPDVNGWGRKVLDFAGDDLWILDTWILDHGRLPRPSVYRSDHSDPSSVFCKLAQNQRWAAATVLLHHFGRRLDPDDVQFVLSETARVMYSHPRRPNDTQGQLDFVKKMVTVFPEALKSYDIISWYSKTKWTLDPSLLDALLKQGCIFDRCSIKICIQDRREYVLRKAIGRRCILGKDFDLFEIGWAHRLLLT